MHCGKIQVICFTLYICEVSTFKAKWMAFQNLFCWWYMIIKNYWDINKLLFNWWIKMYFSISNLTIRTSLHPITKTNKTLFTITLEEIYCHIKLNYCVILIWYRLKVSLDTSDGAWLTGSFPSNDLGKAITSRILVVFSKTESNRSNPNAIPPWGGQPEPLSNK